MLGGLLAPLRVPERVVEALESLAVAARELGPMRSELTRVREQTEPLSGLMPVAEQLLENTERVLAVAERISRQAEPLAELLPALKRVEEALGERIDSLREVVGSLESEESHLNKRVGELVGELRTMHQTVSGLQEDVEGLSERLPDPSRGPIEKARDALTGSDY